MTAFPNYMSQHGATLVANGYSIIPIQPGTKAPGQFSRGAWGNYKGWARHCDRATTEAEVQQWSGWPSCAIGLAGGSACGVDIDIPDAEVAYQVERLARLYLGDTQVMRVGQHPKRMLIYRTAAPFPSRKTKPLEVLCHGTQFVLHAIHPVTLQPYDWPTATLLDTDISSLPEIGEADVDTFYEQAWRVIPDQFKRRGVNPQVAPSKYAGALGASIQGKRGTVDAIRAALEFVPNQDLDRADWVGVGMALKGALGEAGYPLWIEWSRQSGKSGKSGRTDTPERTWASLKPQHSGAGSLYYRALEAGWKPAAGLVLNGDLADLPPIDLSGFLEKFRRKVPARPPVANVVDLAAEREARGQPDKPAVRQIEWIAPADWHGQSIPDREWVVQDWLPIGCVTLLYGTGGVGKTLLAQQLATACATGQPWLGQPTMRCPAICLLGEDDRDELHRRQVSINAAFGAAMPDLTDLMLGCGIGVDITLASLTSAGLNPTAGVEMLRQIITSYGARLLVIDNAALTFGGNEIVRQQVHQFVNMLTALAMDTGCAILLLAHPSKSGSTSDQTSGSTGWNAAARSRWSLEYPRCPPDAEPDAYERILRRLKANYAAKDASIVLRWHQGAFAAPGVGLMAPAQDDDTAPPLPHAQAVFLDLVRKYVSEQKNVSDNPMARNYAPKMFSRREDKDGCSEADFKRAMKSLMASKSIVIGKFRGDRYRTIMIAGEIPPGVTLLSEAEQAESDVDGQIGDE